MPTRRCTRPSAPAARPMPSSRRAWTLDVREQVELQTDLRQALERSSCELYYQPKIHARSGQITGVEALMRWDHPTRGLMSRRGVHSGGRALRPDRHHRQLGDRRGLPADSRTGSTRACACAWRSTCRCTSCARTIWCQRIRRALDDAPRRPRAADLRDHRVGGDGRHAGHDALPSSRSARVGVSAVDRRLRHRLLEPGLPAQAAGRGS